MDQLYRNQVWGQKSNYVEVPTDCPQRDERMGYTGDGHVFARTGMYNFDTEAFWAKFLRDIRYSQMDNTEGYVPPPFPPRGRPEWASSICWAGAAPSPSCPSFSTGSTARTAICGSSTRA